MANYRVTVEPISEEAKEKFPGGGPEIYELEGLVLLGNDGAENLIGKKNATKETVVILGKGCTNSVFYFLTESIPEEIKSGVGRLMMLKDLGLLQNEVMAAVK